MPYLELYILTVLRANDAHFISVDRKMLDLSIYIYTSGTVNSLFVEIHTDSTKIKMTLVSDKFSFRNDVSKRLLVLICASHFILLPKCTMWAWIKCFVFK